MSRYQRAQSVEEARHRMRFGLLVALPVVATALVVAWLWIDAGILLLALAPVVGRVAALRMGRRRGTRSAARRLGR